MSTQTVMVELPESLYRSASRIAQATQRPLADILQESLAHTLPPLEDVTPEEAIELARLSNLDDAALWQVSYATLPAVDQYRLQGERFSEAVRGVGVVPVGLEDAIDNMSVIDALFRSARSGRWESPS